MPAAVENIKSASIIDLDSQPPYYVNAGEGGPGIPTDVYGSCAITGTASSAGSTYQLVRLPVNAVIQSLKLWLDAASTTITGDIGVTFSTSPTDGTPTGDQPNVFGGAPVYVNTIAPGSTGSAEAYFADALALAAVIAPTDYSSGATGGWYNSSARLNTLWQNMGLTTAPAGMLDITFTLSSTAGAAAVLNCLVSYIVP